MTKAIILIVILASGQTVVETNIPGPIQCQRMQEAWQEKGALAFCVERTPNEPVRLSPS
jgi:hypothetical protein